MKPTKLTIKNIGMIESEEIEINKSLLLFYGDILQGKTTILNSIKLLFGGSFPDDLIRHGEKEGSVKMDFENGMISRSFYINKKGDIVAKPIKFILNNEPVKHPADAIKSLLNPFLLDQDFLRHKDGLERQRYFVELFGVDTGVLDEKYKLLESEAKDLRSAIKTYGEIDITPVDEPDIVKLKVEKNGIEKENQVIIDAEYERREKFNKDQDELTEKLNIISASIDDADDKVTDLVEGIKSFKAQLIVMQNTIDVKTKILAMAKEKKKGLKVDYGEITAPKPKLSLMFQFKDKLKSTVKIDENISNAKADEILFKAYQANVTRNNEKILKGEWLKEKEGSQRDIKADKIKLLAGKSKDTGIADFAFDEDGNARFQNTSMDMLSTSQIMNLSTLLSSLYPPGLGIELIDRGESLGKSIYGLIDEAKKKERTILATVVGNKPAKVSDEIGVYVVERGRIK